MKKLLVAFMVLLLAAGAMSLRDTMNRARVRFYQRQEVINRADVSGF